MSTEVRGSIRTHAAYAQGKMLDHSRWSGVLPRLITPSDIDIVFDDARNCRVCFCELSRSSSTWIGISTGQRRLYSRLVASGHGKVFAVLLKHCTPVSNDIDTYSGVESFQVMRFAALLGTATSDVLPGSEWPTWVSKFYDGQSL